MEFFSDFLKNKGEEPINEVKNRLSSFNSKAAATINTNEPADSIKMETKLDFKSDEFMLVKFAYEERQPKAKAFNLLRFGAANVLGSLPANVFGKEFVLGVVVGAAGTSLIMYLKDRVLGFFRRGGDAE